MKLSETWVAVIVTFISNSLAMHGSCPMYLLRLISTDLITLQSSVFISKSNKNTSSMNVLL